MFFLKLLFILNVFVFSRESRTCEQLEEELRKESELLRKEAALRQRLQDDVRKETEDRKQLHGHVKALSAQVEKLQKGISERERRQNEGFAFTTVLNHPEHVHQGNTLKFNKILYNVGNMYNPVTGIATITQPGTYLFSVTIEHWDSTELVCKLMVDGTDTIDVIINPRGYSQQASSTAVLGLTAGQTVWIETTEGSLWGEPQFKGTLFTGALMYLTDTVLYEVCP